MKQVIEIEDVQPIKDAPTKQGRPFKYPFAALEVGQAFWVSEKASRYVNLYVAKWRRNRVGDGRRFVMTKGTKDGRNGYRIQRVK